MKEKHSPLFLECHRLTKINNRSMDISVVLDLMIHDIDLVIQMIHSPIKDIIADGISVISENIDLANVKLIFENGDYPIPSLWKNVFKENVIFPSNQLGLGYITKKNIL